MSPPPIQTASDAPTLVAADTPPSGTTTTEDIPPRSGSPFNPSKWMTMTNEERQNLLYKIKSNPTNLDKIPDALRAAMIPEALKSNGWLLQFCRPEEKTVENIIYALSGDPATQDKIGDQGETPLFYAPLDFCLEKTVLEQAVKHYGDTCFADIPEALLTTAHRNEILHLMSFKPELYPKLCERTKDEAIRSDREMLTVALKSTGTDERSSYEYARLIGSYWDTWEKTSLDHQENLNLLLSLVETNMGLLKGLSPALDRLASTIDSSDEAAIIFARLCDALENTFEKESFAYFPESILSSVADDRIIGLIDEKTYLHDLAPSYFKTRLGYADRYKTYDVFHASCINDILGVDEEGILKLLHATETLEEIPNEIIYDNIYGLLEDLPNPLALKFALTIHQAANNENNRDIKQLLLESVHDDSKDERIDDSKRALLSCELTPDIKLDIQKGTLSKLIYPDQRTFVRVNDPQRYIQEMKAWLTLQEVETFDIQSLLTQKRFNLLCQSKNEDAILYLTEQDFEHYRSTLNELLETGHWCIDGIKRKLPCRIIIVGSNNLSDDAMSRVAYHTDLKSMSINGKPEAKSTEEKLATDQTDHLNNEEVIESTLSDATRLLKSKFNNWFYNEPNLDSEAGKQAAVLCSSQEEFLHHKNNGHQGELYLPSNFPIADGEVATSLPVTTENEHAWVLNGFATNIEDLLDFYISKARETSPDVSIKDIFKNAHILINNWGSSSLMAAVYEDDSGQPTVRYKGESYSVKSLKLSSISTTLDQVQQSNSFLLLNTAEKETLKSAYENGKYFAKTPQAKGLYQHLEDFANNHNKSTITFIEGEPAAGKDSYTSQFLLRLKAIRHRDVHVHHFTGGYDVSLVDELLKQRAENPKKLLVLHVSEANLFGPKAWKEAMNLIEADGGIKIVGTINSSTMGGRYDLNKIAPSYELTPMEWSDQVRMLEERLKIRSNFAKSLVNFHDRCIQLCKQKAGCPIPTLRQLTSLADTLAENRFGLDQKQLYDRVHRIYGHYFSQAEISCFNLDAIEQFMQIAEKLLNHQSLTVNSIRKQDMSFDSSEPDPQHTWDDTFATSLMPDHWDASNIDPDLPRCKGLTSVSVSPMNKISLCTQPGTQHPYVFARSEKTGKMVSFNMKDDLIKEEDGSYSLMNTTKEPLIFEVWHELGYTVKKFSENPIIEGELIQEIDLSKQETNLLREIIHWHPDTLFNIHSLEETTDPTQGDQQLSSIELQQLAMTLNISNTSDQNNIIQSVFQYFNGFDSTEDYNKTPSTNNRLDNQDEALLHAFLSRKGVCRQQARLMQVVLKAFGIDSTLHINSGHAFITVGDNHILDVNYFRKKNVDRKPLFNALETVIKKLDAAIFFNLEINISDDMSITIKRARQMLLHPHQISYEEFEQVLTKISSILTNLVVYETESMPPPVNPSYKPSTQGAPNIPTPSAKPVKEKTDKSEVKPENFCALIESNSIKKSELSKAIKHDTKSPDSDFATWLKAADTYLNTVRTSPNERKKQERVYRDVTDIIFRTMIEKHPIQQDVLTTEFIPKAVLESKHLPGRVTSVRDHNDEVTGYLVAVHKPALDFGNNILFDMPEAFTSPFLILTIDGLREIDSQETFLAEKEKNSLLTLTDIQQDIFRAILQG